MLLEFGIILVLIIANGLFAGTELAMVSARRGRLQQLAEEGNQNATAALKLQSDPNRLLSTVQVGITLIGTIASVFGGASTAERLTELFTQVPVLAPYAETLALVVVILIISYLSLVIGELVPKRLALQSAEQIAMLMAGPMRFISAGSRPVIAILAWSTEALLALLGRRNVAESGVTEDDIRQMVREGAQGGSVEPHEQEIIESLFTMGDRNVRQIMTPRTEVYAIEADDLIGDVIDETLENGFSRFPVYEGKLDDVVGVVHTRDLLVKLRAGDTQAVVRDVMRPPLIVPETSPAADLLPLFRKSQQHMAIVVGELGTVEGIVTLEDVLEEIVGEIADEYDDSAELPIIQREDGSFLIEGRAPIDDVADELNLRELPENGGFDTIAGMILSLMGRIPRTGESIGWGGWRFEVVDMDGLRIDKVLASSEKETPEAKAKN